ncbi:hypothetical protein, partial [Bifidobacterium catenulatum]|uniref:hypothetical protein n=1 Tax=Bifidobacterium catenulatum TaxID=1686 RepID=UPI003F9169CA
NLKERNITLLRGLLFVNALAHGNRTKFPQLTLFPSGGAVFLWKMCSHSWSRALVCRYRNEEG